LHDRSMYIQTADMAMKTSQRYSKFYSLTGSNQILTIWVFIESVFSKEELMDPFTLLPEKKIALNGEIAKKFLELGIPSFRAACEYVHKLPYGYNSDRDDSMILFKQGIGTCTTKHAVIATLARELGLPIVKNIGIYAMTEILVTGTAAILGKHNLPYLPMIHCFLVYDRFRVDITEGNDNGKNGPIDQLIYSVAVQPNIPAKEEYLIYRNALKGKILKRKEFEGVELKTILLAREEGLALLKANLH